MCGGTAFDMPTSCHLHNFFPDVTGGVPKEWKMNVYDRGEAMGNYRLLTIPIFSIIRSFCT